jgi:hypothetical protein
VNTFTLIVTILSASIWDGSPQVKYEQRLENLSEASCARAAADWHAQYASHDRTTLVVLCVRK